MPKIDLKMAKIAKLGKMSLVVCYLLPWQLGMILQSILFLNNTKQKLLFKYNDKTYLYQSTKVAINWPQNT